MEEVAVTVRSLLLSGWIGLAGTAWGEETPRATPAEPRKLHLETAEPMATVTANQHMANAIAAALGKNSQIRRYQIDVVYAGGVVELHGQVADDMQRDLVRHTVLSVPGVVQVRDRLLLVSGQVETVQDKVPVLPPDKNTIIAPGVTVVPPSTAPGFPPMPSKTPVLTAPPAPPAAGLPPEPTP